MKDLIQTKHFRIAPITRIQDLDDNGRLQFEKLPTAMGVAIEAPIDKGRWIVVVYVLPRYDIRFSYQENGFIGVECEEFDDRLLDLSFFERLELKRVINTAKKMVIAANKGK